jgi:signal transduction histidine kinase
MRWRLIGTTLRRHHEVILAIAFVAMASYELLEMRALEPRRSQLSLLLHAFQVLLILIATYTVLHAWRRRTAHAEAMAHLMEKVVMAQEEERRRVAYDLHDGVAQLLVSAKQHLDTCADMSTVAAARASQELAIGLDRLGQAITEIRRMLLALRPAPIDEAGLVAAARESLEQAAQESGWSVGFVENLNGLRVSAAVETAAFRILQEALANARRHADASRVDVALRREGDWLVLEVRDVGRGLPAGDSALDGRGLGLSSMRDRARLLGGICTVRSQPGEGTLVQARLPLRPGGVDEHVA